MAEKAKNKQATEKTAQRRRRAPKLLRAPAGYFAGSWQELRQTTWPTRRAAWGLTLAVIIFTAAMMGFMVVIDYLFDLLFKQLVL